MFQNRQVIMEFVEIAKDFDDEDELQVYTSEKYEADYNIWRFRMLHDPANLVPAGEIVAVFMPTSFSNNEKVKSTKWFAALFGEHRKVPKGTKTMEAKDAVKKQWEKECIGVKVIGYQPDIQKELIVTQEKEEYTSHIFKGMIAPCPDETIIPASSQAPANVEKPAPAPVVAPPSSQIM